MKTLLFPAVVGAAMLVVPMGCEKKAEPTNPPGQATAPADDHGHDHDHDHADGHDDHHGESIALGEATAGPFLVKAARDEGAITPGGEAAIDVWVEGAAADAPKVAAVRFWLGTEDGAGSMKAKGEVETPSEPSRWHSHAEVPDPLPAGSKLWVEVEDASGATAVASFELK